MCDENWQDVLEANNIDQAVNLLEFKIRMNMNKCMPVRTVTMSTRDPGWMTPLVKHMLRNKSRISVSRTDRNRDVSNRISEVIRENRLLFLNAKMGSRDWWKSIDAISQRRHTSTISLDKQTILDLNEYFSELCTDSSYSEHTFPNISRECAIPEISER